MNFSIFKKKDNVKIESTENDENIFNIKDLYVAFPALLTRNSEEGTYRYNGNKAKEPIICKLKNNEKVINVLNGREYYIFRQILLHHNAQEFVGRYVVSTLQPLETTFKGYNKLIITKEEIIELLYPNIEKEKTFNNIQDIVLKQVGETDDKINKSSLDEEVKEILKKKLIELAHYYVDSLKNMSNIKNSVNLTKNNLSVIDLRREVMSKLVEIELQLPPEEVDILYDELDILEHKIKEK